MSPQYLRSLRNQPSVKEDRLVFFFLTIYFLILVALALIKKGTGDDGDSTYHFLFSRYAFAHPENFIDHWAKPVFVLLSSPFAQFGFIGIKIFNITITTLTIFFTYRITQLMRTKNGWFIVLALCCTPMYLQLTLSGLTEPLFALSFTIVILLALRNQLFFSSLLASFLPFMRSEGLVILVVYTFFLLFKRKYKLIPLLATGHVVYSIIGWSYYRDFLWVFNRMTYAVWNSAYGSGSMFTFIYGMKDFIGYPLVILFCIGLLIGAFWLFRDLFLGDKNFSMAELWLVYGGFLSVWISHMIFWSFGLFNSFGLIRVLIAVIPCAGIICLRGFNSMLDLNLISGIPFFKKAVIVITIIALITNSYLQLKTQCAFDLSGNQKAILNAADKYKDQVKGHTIYASSGYVAIAFGYDIFDSTQYRNLNEINQQKTIPEKSFLIWDNFYAPNESKVALANLSVDDRFILLDTFQTKDCSGYQCKSAVFSFHGIPKDDRNVVDTLFANNFNNGNFNGKDSTTVFSGKFSCKIDSLNAYAPEFNIAVDSLGFNLPAFVRVEARFNISLVPFDQQKHPVFVVSLERNQVVYFWQGLDIDTKIHHLKVWEKVSFDVPVPIAMDGSDVLKVYVWNPHALAIFMDDFYVLQLAQMQ